MTHTKYLYFWSSKRMFAVVVVAFLLISASLAVLAAEPRNREPQLISLISGEGTPGQIPKFLTANSIGDSVITENATGNVGIGITNPSNRLMVNGHGEFIGGVYANSVHSRGGYDLLLQADDGNANVSFYTGTSEKMRITSSGNVGIGTVSPETKLDLRGGSYTALTIKSTGESSTGIYLGDGAYQDGWRLLQGAGLHGADFMISYPNSPNYLYFGAYGGNIGIGTMNPQAKLHVGGSALFDGNVGIGTTNPSERLDLGGGNIKMGYEIVSDTWNNSSQVTVSCPSGKQVIGGGCSLSYALPDMALYWSYPVNNGWACAWNQTMDSPNAYAICANIR